MTTTDSTAASHAPAVLEPSEYDKYMLRAPAEIQVVLHGLCTHVAQITVFFNEGQDMLLTSLADVASDHLVLDFGASGELNNKALEADRHFCVALLDKVRIQFILRRFDQVEYEGRPAFRTELPKELLRLQRREYYRLVTPVVRPLKCAMSIPLPEGKTHLYEASVFDISGGGMGISAPPDGIPFHAGMEIPDCRIDLPEVGLVTCRVRVCSVFEITLRSGVNIKRAGCEFISLSGQMGTLVQRYIIKVERERKARESGLA